MNQGNFANAALLIEQCIKTKLSYNISNLFEEEYLKEKIINKVGSEEGYFELLKSQNITPIISLSKFMNPEIEIMDSRNKKMILIPSGRVFYEDKPPFLLDSAFILKNVEPLLKNEFDLSYIDDFSKETVVYSFYVDEETVSEDEFNTYFLAQSDSIEKPSFTAENVIEFSESQGKIPLTTMEWTKLYKGLNYNLSDQCKLFNSNYSEEKYSEYFNTFYNTIQISESYNNVYDVLALLKFNKRNKFSTKLPYDTSLLVLIAFSNILDTSEKKLKVLQNLAHSDSDQRETLFEILKDGIRDFKDRLSSNKEYLKLFGISQKNIWQITLKYFFDIEMKFNIIKENDPQEAVIMAKDGINYLVSKNPNKGMWTQDNIISSSKFIPFRCMKIVNHEYKQN
ncbi:MAG: hypothetical protein IPN46_13830 [Saprospiraceae bacterium]|nr:hypothetical protein [Saprospiraceae bacterium]